MFDHASFFTHTHELVSLVASHATALNIGIILLVRGGGYSKYPWVDPVQEKIADFPTLFKAFVEHKCGLFIV